MINPSDLKNFDFPQGFTEAEFDALASVAVPTEWKEGETVFQARSTATRLYLLKTGTILLSFPNGSSLPLINSGHALGWSSMVSPFRYTATAICLTDAVLYEFPAPEMYRLIQMDADLAQRLMHKIAALMEQRRPYQRPRKAA